MGKRRNENAQQSREDWEGTASDEEAEATPSGAFQLASEDELQRRKIRRASDQYKPPAPSSSIATPSTSTNLNPFASLLLKPPQPDVAASAPSAAVPTDRLPELIQAFQAHIKDCEQNKIRADWSRAMKQYKEFHRVITAPNLSSLSPAAAPPPPAAAAAPPPPAPATPSTTTTSHTSPSTSTRPSSEGVHADPNSKWKKFHETKAKCFSLKGGKWSTFTGSLSLEHDGNSKILVIRDEAIGHLRFNVALPTDIKYHEENNSKGQVQKTIQFLTKEKAEEPPFMVRLKTAPENLTPLYNAIQELAAKSM